MSPNSSKVIRIGVSPSKQGSTSPGRTFAQGTTAGGTAKAEGAVQGSTAAVAVPQEGSILSMMLDTVGMEVKGQAQQGTGSNPDAKTAQANHTQQGSTLQDSAAIQQLVVELEAARQKCEELTLENIK